MFKLAGIEIRLQPLYCFCIERRVGFPERPRLSIRLPGTQESRPTGSPAPP